MSGHSKWAQIKRQKGVADTKRGQEFTKLSSAISIAVRHGGDASPEQNFRLRLLIDKARSINMPKDNIERAIERGKGRAGSAESLEEVVYEGFGPQKVSVIVEAATDNKLRTNGFVKTVFDKNGGILANPGSVSYQFQKLGAITIRKTPETSGDDIFLQAADAGATDIDETPESIIIYTNPENTTKVKDVLVESGVVVSEYELTFRPHSFISVTLEEANRIADFLEKIEELDDVQKVYSNYTIKA